MKRRTGVFLFILVLGVIFLSVGLHQTITTYSTMRNADETTGTVIETDIESKTQKDTTSDNNEEKTHYYPIVKYNYTIKGKQYTCSSVYPDGNKGFGDKSKAKDIINQYEVGDEVEVHYTPENPDEAFLKDDTPYLWIGFTAIGGFITLLMAYLIVKNFRTPEKTREEKLEEAPDAFKKEEEK